MDAIGRLGSQRRACGSHSAIFRLDWERIAAQKRLKLFQFNHKENGMPKDAHNKAAEHHENAAKSHKLAADHHGKGDHTKGREESSKAKTHSKTAHDHSEMADDKSRAAK
jgi:hypothetical protein